MIPGCGIDFERATEKPQSMSLTQSARAGIRDALGVVKLIAGLVLLVALSWEIIAGDHVHMSRTYLAIQFVVCLVFLCDFFVRWAAAERPGRFFWRNLPFLLLSVPYLNNLIAGTPYEEMPLDEIVRKADGGIFNNAAQAWNHTFFFRMLTPAQQPMPAKLAAKLTEAFGSVEAFKEQFTKAAVGLFGSGWAWLAMDKAGKLSIVAKPNAGNPMTDGLRPVMTVDVWEHAYYIDYRNRRPDFLAAFWELIDWQKVADRCIPKRYKCTACDYVYDPAKGDPETGIEPGTPFEEIPDDWTCPICGLYKTDFEAVEE